MAIARRSGQSRAAVSEGDRALRRSAARSAEDFRQLRIRAGVSQAAVARAIGVTRSVICRLEQGDPDVSARIRARAAAAVGAEFRMALYADRDPVIHDAAHARIVERLLELRNAAWRATVESPVPGGGRRSTDVRLDRGSDVVLVEVETRVQALEAIVRECADKRAAVRAAEPDRRVHVLLVLPRTRHHRAIASAHPGIIRAAFPVPSERLLATLADPTEPWPGDGILWLDAPGRATRVAPRRGSSTQSVPAMVLPRATNRSESGH